MSEMQVTPGWTEAIAALLYNEIYDLCGDDEGAWTPTNRREDDQYLAFAEGLLIALRDAPSASDEGIVRMAAKHAPSAYNLMNEGRQFAGAWSDPIVIDQEYSSLTIETNTIMPIIRGFIESPPVGSQEQEFILQEEIAKEDSKA